uniref:Ig-like domain-containing protein n=1 Tax=Hippocampus comes TaxID=109280 RepID=A0A3Q2Z3U9_HIPCM
PFSWDHGPPSLILPHIPDFVVSRFLHLSSYCAFSLTFFLTFSPSSSLCFLVIFWPHTFSDFHPLVHPLPILSSHTSAELPTVSLLQKMPSSSVTCHATGFYPSASALFWRKDSEVIHEDVEMGETLPNHDGTFQTTARLKVEVTAGVEGKYECVFQLAGVEEDIVTKLDRRIILKVKKMMTILVTLVILALVGVVVVAGFHNQIR